MADRARPDYDALGTSLGGFTLFPSVQFSLDATDNYRATNTNRQGDAALTVQPALRLTSNWNRHRVDASTYYARSFHFDRGEENVDLYGGAASGTYDVSRRTSVRADLSAAHAAESRASLGSFRNSAEPVRYSNYRAGLAITQELAGVTLGGRVSAERINYNDALLTTGTIIDQDFRDVRVVTAGASAQYDLRNGIGLLASAQYDQNRYDFGPGDLGFDPTINVDRRSSGLRLQGGVSLELTKLVLGYVQVGYLTRRYRDPRLRDSNGLSFDADVLWNVTPLTSLRFRARRSFEETSSQLIAGNRRNDFSIRVDHELYRNVILNGDINYGHFSPDGPGFGGNEYGVGLGARYLVNRRMSFSAGVRHSRRDSDSPFLRYNATSAGVSFRFAL